MACSVYSEITSHDLLLTGGARTGGAQAVVPFDVRGPAVPSLGGPAVSSRRPGPRQTGTGTSGDRERGPRPEAGTRTAALLCT